MLDFGNKVSIIIPVYNSEKFLKESIDSVINQTYSDVEVICINDGSTDGSLDILSEFGDDITIITQPNMGLAVALNTGIEKSSGRWFKWFSPDDKIHPLAIETLVNTAKNLDDNTIVYSNWGIIDETGKTLRSFTETNYNNLDIFDFNVRLLDGQQINVNTTLIPSLLSKKIRMNNNIDPVLVDYDFFLRAGLLHQTKFNLIEKPLIEFRVHNSQLSHKKITQSLQHLELVREDILSNLDEKLKDQYIVKWKIYQKKKPISKKSLETGLKIISTLPNPITDKILVFYLNKIRRNR